MLEDVPAWLGKALKNVRAGHGKLAVAKLGSVQRPRTLPLSSDSRSTTKSFCDSYRAVSSRLESPR